MRNLLKKLKKNPLKSLTFVVFIYPILPLMVLSVFSAIMLGIGAFTDDIPLEDSIYLFLLLLLFIGGPIGFIGLLLSFFNKHLYYAFWMMVYGLVSFFIVVAYMTVVSIFTQDVLLVLHQVYLYFSFFIIITQISKVSKKLKKVKHHET